MKTTNQIINRRVTMLDTLHHFDYLEHNLDQTDEDALIELEIKRKKIKGYIEALEWVLEY